MLPTWFEADEHLQHGILIGVRGYHRKIKDQLLLPVRSKVLQCHLSASRVDFGNGQHRRAIPGQANELVILIKTFAIPTVLRHSHSHLVASSLPQLGRWPFRVRWPDSCSHKGGADLL